MGRGAHTDPTSNDLLRDDDDLAVRLKEAQQGRINKGQQLVFRPSSSQGSKVAKKSKMSEAHKKALAKGRAQSKAVREYLSLLERDGRRSSNLSRDQLDAKIHELQTRIDDEPNPATRVELIQKRLDYEARLDTVEDAPDPDTIEKAFVKAAKEYSERKGITYPAWREVGVPASALKAAGIPQTRRTAS